MCIYMFRTLCAYYKSRFCALSWLISKIILRCMVSKTSKLVIKNVRCSLLDSMFQREYTTRKNELICDVWLTRKTARRHSSSRLLLFCMLFSLARSAIFWKSCIHWYVCWRKLMKEFWLCRWKQKWQVGPKVSTTDPVSLFLKQWFKKKLLQYFTTRNYFRYVYILPTKEFIIYFFFSYSWLCQLLFYNIPLEQEVSNKLLFSCIIVITWWGVLLRILDTGTVKRRLIFPLLINVFTHASNN